MGETGVGVVTGIRQQAAVYLLEAKKNPFSRRGNTGVICIESDGDERKRPRRSSAPRQLWLSKVVYHLWLRTSST